MCGRVYQTLDIYQLLRLAGTMLVKNPDTFQSCSNVGPTDHIPVICHREPTAKESSERVLELLKWGYESPFRVLIINARAEELQLKRTFKPLMDTRRCVAIVQGYFQWNSRREPYVFKPKHQGDVKEETQASESEQHEQHEPCFYFAALQAPDDSVIVLTREAVGMFHHIHPRMPVILTEDEVDMWLDMKKHKFVDIQDKILDEKSKKWTDIEFYQVAPYVNNVRDKSDRVFQRFAEHEQKLEDEGIMKYFEPVGTDEFDEGEEEHEKDKEVKAEKKIEEKKEKKDQDRETKHHETGELHQTKIGEFFPIAENGKEEEKEKVVDVKKKVNGGKTKEKKNNGANESSHNEKKAKEVLEKVDENRGDQETREYKKILNVVPELGKWLEEKVEEGKTLQVKKAIVVTIEDENSKKSESLIIEEKDGLNKGLKKRKGSDDIQDDKEHGQIKKKVKKTTT